MSDEQTQPLPPPATLSAADGEALDEVLAQLIPENRAEKGTPAGDPARVAKMQQLLNVLGSQRASSPPLGLAQRTLRHVQDTRARLQSQERSTGLRGPLIPFSWAEFSAVAAMVMVVISLGLPTLVRTRDESRRMACQNNLGLTGDALLQYADDFSSTLPRGQTAPDAVWWKVGGDERADGALQSNSAHLYLLARAGYIDPRAMACPENLSAPRSIGRQMHDWSEYNAVSYSYQNQYSAQPVRVANMPRMAVLADKNPLFAVQSSRQFRYNPEGLSTGASSKWHKRGQNILAADGHVGWSDSPILRGNDNIWLIKDVNEYAGKERPTQPDDTFLVP